MVSNWRQAAIDLPNDVDEYKLLLEGEYNKSSSYYSRNYVAVDNLELRSCSVKGNFICGHLHITYS